ncbi:unnamed protein product [Prunus armeniaca]
MWAANQSITHSGKTYIAWIVDDLKILAFSIIAHTYNNISLGSSLTAKDNNNSVWCSPFGEFAFSFQKIGSDGGFIRAIWFNKIPEKDYCLVSQWQQSSATRIHSRTHCTWPVATGKQKGIADFGGTGVAYAAMLDT